MKNFLKKFAPGLITFLRSVSQPIKKRLIEFQKKRLPSKIEKLARVNSELIQVSQFLKVQSAEMIPYSFIHEYRSKSIKIFEEGNFWFYAHNDRKIYFPRILGKDYVIESIRVGLMEQDIRSPHRYLPIDSMPIGGNSAVLCGASDCMYALSIVDNFKRLYLFEANPIWVDSIKMTLKEYLHKVEIVPFYVSNEVKNGSITIDSFFEGKNDQVDYIQADIENDEIKMLVGARGILTKFKNIKLSICCYHTSKQEAELTKYLEGLNFEITPSQGYVLMWMQFPLMPPYVRRAVLYAYRNSS